MPGAGYKYKFLNKEYEDSFALNVTETDFRHYDSAIGRFSSMDLLSELAYDFTPYRYGFNNPVYWQDKTGLFESWDQAINFMLEHGMSGSIMRSDYDDTFVIAGSDEFSGRFWENFYETSYHPIVTGQGGGSDDSPGFKLLGFSPSEIGLLANGASVYAGALKANSESNMNYKYKAGSKTHTAKQLTELNKVRMEKIAKVANKAGTRLTIVSAGATVVDGLANGWQNHHTADLVITGALYAVAAATPIGWVVGGVYFIADMAVIANTGQSITEHLFN